MPFLTVQGRQIEYIRLHPNNPAPQRPVIVMLHEGLGSIAMWRDFPQRVADTTGSDVVVYSRYGYGNSTPFTGIRKIDFMHREALDTLPDLLNQLQLEKPILLGHSDGGSIALILAGGTKTPLSGIILMAPHVIVEAVTVKSIEAAREAYDKSGLRERLAKYHADVDGAFGGWVNIWLAPDFLRWDITEYLPAISCPLLAMQGEDDEYGTMEQIEIIKRATPQCELLKIPRCGHSPHRDQPEAVLKGIVAFLEKLPPLHDSLPNNSGGSATFASGHESLSFRRARQGRTPAQ